ncbi:MAG: sigma-70 family RNA polymerase sigma factor [Planctomycetota bacterium]
MQDQPEQLVENFFRHESANLIALLTRAFGFSLVDVVEDMVQEAMMEALRSWRIGGIPKNPDAWLYRVAKNRIIDVLRRDRSTNESVEDHLDGDETLVISFTDDAFEDSLLRLIFVCCHPSLDEKSQVALTLKMLCGLGDHEIASGLLMSAAAVKKRVTRAKRHLQLTQVSMELPASKELQQRIEVVHDVLYLLFNEGYSASKGALPIRIDLCEEAARLCHLLCRSEIGQPSTYALLALMLFHAARFDSRVDGDGEIILLEDQDRGLWDQNMIGVADAWLNRSARGGQVSRFHLEAGISRLHCRATSIDETDWQGIVALYDLLLRTFPSPMYTLNRAIALGRLGKLTEAIGQIQLIANDSAMKDYSLLWCSLADLHQRQGELEDAHAAWQHALTLTSNPRDQQLIQQRIEAATID